MRRLLLVALLLSLPLSARAQVELPSLPQSTEVNLGQIVVLAAKRPQPLREAAASTSVITAADLQAFGWRDFTEAITSLAGFYASSAGDTTNLGVRGIGPRGDNNGRVLILVDGHAQNELWSHSAYPELLGLDASLIDHLEVLRGPASALWGSLGFLAIINVVTRHGTPLNWVQATYEMQDARLFRGAATVGHRFASGLEVAFSLQAHHTLGYAYDYPELAAQPCSPTQLAELPRSCLTRSDPSTDEGTGVSVYGHLDYKGLSVRGSYQRYDKNIPFAPYQTLLNEQNRYLLERGYVELGYDAGRPSLVEGTFRAFFDAAGYADDLAYSSDMTRAGRYTFHDQASPWWTGLDAKLILERGWRDLVHFTLTAGGEFTFFRGNDVSGSVGKAGVSLAHDLELGAVYAQTELDWARKLYLTVGARGDFASVFPSALSPRAALVLLPHPSTTLKLLYAHGFIHPSWYETFFNDGVSVLDNPRLKPESDDNFELVLQQEAAGLLLSGSLFYIHGTDLIQQRPVCLAPGGTVDTCPTDQLRVQSQNVAAFQSYGAELSVSGTLKHDIRLYANYGWAHAVDGAARAFNSPEHQLKLGVSVPLWRRHLFAGAELRVISPRLTGADAAAETPTAVIVNAHLSWRDLPKGLAATLKVYDLTAQDYFEPSTAESSAPITTIKHTGPTVVLRLSYAY